MRDKPDGVLKEVWCSSNNRSAVSVLVGPALIEAAKDSVQRKSKRFWHDGELFSIGDFGDDGAVCHVAMNNGPRTPMFSLNPKETNDGK